jgi:ABC-2 type transport system ATP-binding protein
VLMYLVMKDFIAEAGSDLVKVRSPQATELAALLRGPGITVTTPSDGVLEVVGLTSDEIGTTAAGAGLTLLELSPQGASLEEAYMALTESSLDYRSGTVAA